MAFEAKVTLVLGLWHTKVDVHDTATALDRAYCVSFSVGEGAD